MNRRLLTTAIAAISSAGSLASFAQTDMASGVTAPSIEEVFIVSKKTTYGNSTVTEGMIAQTSPVASVLGAIKTVPGVLINEGDAFGGDDWSTTISIRGFQVNLDEQQLGMTVDGIPNGNSNYGGGAKANRFIDTFNLQGIEVSQGTSDIASRSHEALGGSLDFTTQDPIREERLRVASVIGDFNARKFYTRYDSGEFLQDTYAWLSVSSSSVDAWMDASGETTRDHFAGKLKGYYDAVELTGYLAYDDTHEDNYERVSLEEFRQNPSWDRLTGEWTGIPHIDQNYRRGWSTLRENLLGYVKADFDLGSVNLSTNIYFHENEGRGDWVPPYIVDVTNDGAAGHSELIAGTTVRGGSSLGTITFVNADGESVAPIAGCTSSLTFPYGGAGPEYDPTCQPLGALPVSSYRHTHYEKSRVGLNVDFDWTVDLAFGENVLRGGLWYEDYTRNESRDWHKIIDARTGYHFDHTPYWEQYSREFPIETTMYYVEDSLRVGPVMLNLGAKQFLVDLERKDLHAGATTATFNSDSDVLINGGLVYETPLDGLEVFAGYAESFAAVKDSVLEAGGSALDLIEPESAENTDLGLRYEGNRISASLTFYDIEFSNRIVFIPAGTSSGIDYLDESEGAYINVGGIESSGIEAATRFAVNDSLSLYISYTQNDSTYLGTGSAAGDEELGIYPGNTVFGSAEDMYVIAADWKRNNYFAGLSWQHVGDRWIDAANEGRLDAYQLADLYVGVELDGLMDGLQGMKLQFNISNLFDESYLGGTSGGWGAWIGAPRTATASLTLDF